MTTDRAGPEGTIERKAACLCPIRRVGDGFKCGEPDCYDLWVHVTKAFDQIARTQALKRRREARATCGQPVETG